MLIERANKAGILFLSISQVFIYILKAFAQLNPNHKKTYFVLRNFKEKKKRGIENYKKIFQFCGI
jgi:hypothetical protein